MPDRKHDTEFSESFFSCVLDFHCPYRLYFFGECSRIRCLFLLCMSTCHSQVKTEIIQHAVQMVFVSAEKKHLLLSNGLKENVSVENSLTGVAVQWTPTKCFRGQQRFNSGFQVETLYRIVIIKSIFKKAVSDLCSCLIKFAGSVSYCICQYEINKPEMHLDISSIKDIKSK